MSAPKKSALFVCLGNICRSPIAEALCKHLVAQRGDASEWLIDSCGTARYHIGESPDQRGQNCMKNHGVTTTHKGRQLCQDDFYKFHYIFGMDDNNISDIERKKPKDSQAIIKLLGSYDPENILEIEDPYYGDADGFEITYQHVERCLKPFLDEVYGS